MVALSGDGIAFSEEAIAFGCNGITFSGEAVALRDQLITLGENRGFELQSWVALPKASPFRLLLCRAADQPTLLEPLIQLSQ